MVRFPPAVGAKAILEGLNPVASVKGCSCGTTCHVVADAHGGEGDHNKVDGLQRGPALDVFEDDSRDGDEDDAAGEDEQEGGCHSYLRLADLSVFLLSQARKRLETRKTWIIKRFKYDRFTLDIILKRK